MKKGFFDIGTDAWWRDATEPGDDGNAIHNASIYLGKATSRKVYLPNDAPWTDFWTGRRLEAGKEIEVPAALETLPLFVRAGSIIPVGPALQYTSEKTADPIELRIYPGADGTITLYEYEGDNYGYEQGRYATIRFDFDDARQTLTTGPREGTFPGMLARRTFRVVIVGEGKETGDQRTEKPDKSFNYDGKAISLTF